MRSFIHCLVAFGLALFGAYLLTPVVEQVARRAGVVRVPRVRDVHSRDLPLWGGIAIVASAVLAIILTVPVYGKHHNAVTGILIGVAFISVFGILDDKYDLSAVIQLAVILFAGWIVTQFGVKVSFLSNPFSHGARMFDLDAHYLSVPLTVLWIFVVTKATDLIDGVDGLAAGFAAITSATLALMALQVHNVVAAAIAASVCGASVGFLRHNFNPARIIMGTIGSQFLGFMLACLSVMSLTKVATMASMGVSLLVMGVPIFDAVFVTAKRALTMQPLTVADKSHVHHRLLRRGFSQRETVLTLYVVISFSCIVALGISLLARR